jgi:hypothetical protein
MYDRSSMWTDAADVLDNARQWRHLNPASWAILDKHLDSLETAVCASQPDAETAGRAVAALELMSPLRCQETTAEPGATSIPADTLDFLDHVDALITELLAERKQARP